MSRKASCGRWRAEDKGDSESAFLLMKGDNSSLRGGWVAPLYIHATVDAKTM